MCIVWHPNSILSRVNHDGLCIFQCKTSFTLQNVDLAVGKTFPPIKPVWIWNGDACACGTISRGRQDYSGESIHVSRVFLYCDAFSHSLLNQRTYNKTKRYCRAIRPTHPAILSSSVAKLFLPKLIRIELKQNSSRMYSREMSMGEDSYLGCVCIIPSAGGLGSPF